MRQLELASIKSVRRRRTGLGTPADTAPALKDEQVLELLRLMAQAIIVVTRSGKEGSDER